MIHVKPCSQTYSARGRAPCAQKCAHTLGYRGHILTKSRAYSTTYAALRAERAHHMGHADVPDVVTERHWRYVGSGHTPGAALIAAGIVDNLAQLREVIREERSAALGEADR
ncbi:replication initiator [Streptomyces sp. NPDC056309]|uniref:replication initiator n=1 Tax=unclassified Streptomyces TaxID=2593676 RepID=UPI0035D9C0B2